MPPSVRHVHPSQSPYPKTLPCERRRISGPTSAPNPDADEQTLNVRATARNLSDHRISSPTLGAGLRLAEILNFNVDDVFVATNGTPRVGVRARPEIAKGGKASGVFLPERLARPCTERCALWNEPTARFSVVG